MLNDFLHRLRSLFRRGKIDRELDDELRFHFDQQVEKFVASGLPLAEARRRARLTIGGTDQIREEYRDSSGVRFLDTLWQDLRFALRMLRKTPGFTAVAVLTLALCIGANTAIFTVVYGILLKPLPFPHSSQLVDISSIPRLPSYIPFAAFDAVDAHARSFQQIAGYYQQAFLLTNAGPPRNLMCPGVTGNFFSLYGVRPILGRPILPADVGPTPNQIAVLSYDLWRHDFGGDPSVIGKKIQLVVALDSASTTMVYKIVGVMPRHAEFPVEGDLWLPLERKFLSWPQVLAVARLKDGVTIRQANAELESLSSGIGTELPQSPRNFTLRALGLSSDMVMGYNKPLLLLLSAVGFLLVLASVSVGSLQVARGWVRRREIAVRETLGATRQRLVRQLLTESCLLSIAGGALGLLLSIWGVRFLVSVAPASTPRLDEIGMNWAALVYTLAISVTAVFVFGLAPALQLSRPELGAALKESGASPFASLLSRRPQPLRNFLVVSEIALAFLLVVGSTLAVRSFEKLTHVDMGYRLDGHLLSMWVVFSPPMHENHAVLNEAIRDLLGRARALPGVQSAAIGAWRPLSSAFGAGRLLIARQSRAVSVVATRTQFQPATPGYFRTLGIPLLAGRSFTENDAQNSTLVAIVNEAMAEDDFSGRPLEKRFSYHEDKKKRPVWLEVVGVVGNTRDEDPAEKPLPGFYIPFAQAQEAGETTLLVRTAPGLPPFAIVPLLRQQVQSVDKLATIEGLQTMEQVMSDSVAEPRFRTFLLSMFAGLGLILTIVGVYGVISFAVEQRTHEIGVRMALGAQPGDVLRLVVGEGLFLAVVGIVAGICGALALTRFLASLLFEIKPTDPATFIGVTTLLLFVALLACYIPARRAMKVDPMVALRYE